LFIAFMVPVGTRSVEACNAGKPVNERARATTAVRLLIFMVCLDEVSQRKN
jgi:hypothetical protein